MKRIHYEMSHLLLALINPYPSMESSYTPRYRLEGFGKRCFTHAAPSLWNTLPISIKCAQSIDTFKSSLKTHLFNVAYSWLQRDIYIISCVFSQILPGVCLISEALLSMATCRCWNWRYRKLTLLLLLLLQIVWSNHLFIPKVVSLKFGYG